MSDDLKRVSELAHLLVTLDDNVANAELALAIAKEDARRVREEALPELMIELELTQIKLEDGTIVSVVPDVQTSISEERRPVAHQWLKDHGYGGLIKTMVGMSFDRTEGELAQRVAAAVSELTNRPAEVEERVHPSTLKSFVRERVEAGDAPPAEPFALRAFNKAKVVLPKPPKAPRSPR